MNKRKMIKNKINLIILFSLMLVAAIATSVFAYYKYSATAGYFFDTFLDSNSNISISSSGKIDNADIKFSSFSSSEVVFDSETAFRSGGSTGTYIDSSGIKIGTLLSNNKKTNFPYGASAFQSSTFAIGPDSYTDCPRGSNQNWNRTYPAIQIIGGLLQNKSVFDKFFCMQNDFALLKYDNSSHNLYSQGWQSDYAYPAYRTWIDYGYTAPATWPNNGFKINPYPVFAAGAWHGGTRTGKFASPDPYSGFYFDSFVSGGIVSTGGAFSISNQIYEISNVSYWTGTPNDNYLSYPPHIYSSVVSDIQLKQPLYGHSFTVVDNIFYIFGGNNDTGYSGNTYYIDSTKPTDDWTTITNGPPARYFHSTTVTLDKKIYMFGGYGNGIYYNDLWYLDATQSTKRWVPIIPTGDLPSARCGHVLIEYSSDKLLLFGGQGEESGQIKYYNDLWEYNITENKWNKLADGPVDNNLNARPEARAFFASTGYVLKDLSKIGSEWDFDQTSYYDSIKDTKILSVVGGYNGPITHPLYNNLTAIQGISMKSDIWYIEPPKTAPFSAEYISPIIERNNISSIGKIIWQQNIPTGTSIDIYVSGSSKTDADSFIFSGSKYSTVNGNTPTEVLPDGSISASLSTSDFSQFIVSKAKYFKFKIVLSTNNLNITPTLSSIKLSLFNSKVTAVTNNSISPLWNSANSGKAWDKVKFSLTLGDNQTAIITVLKDDGTPVGSTYSKTITTAGTTTETIDIKGINPLTYPGLKLQAELIRQRPDGNPSFDDWFVSWVDVNNNSDPQLVITGDDFTFYPNVIGDANGTGDINNYGEQLWFQWSFGDGTVEDWNTMSSATHKYTSAGTFNAKIKIARDGGSRILTEETFSVISRQNFICSNQGESEQVQQDENNILVATINTFSNTPIDWNSLKLNIINFSDLKSLKLYKDDGDKFFNKDKDTIIAQTSNLQSNTVIPITNAKISSNETIYFLVADVSIYAVPATTASFGNFSPDTFATTKTLPASIFPESFAPTSLQILSCNPTVTITAAKTSALTAYVNEKVDLLEFYASTDKDTLTSIKSLKLFRPAYMLDSGYNSDNISSIEVVTVDQYGKETFCGSYLNFFSDIEILIKNSEITKWQKHFIIRAYINNDSIATPGQLVGLSIKNASFNLSGGTINNTTSNLPFSSNDLMVNVRNMNVNTAATDLIPTKLENKEYVVYQGDDINVADLAFTADKGNSTWKNIKLSKVILERSGNGKDSDIEKLSLFYNTECIATTTLESGIATFNIPEDKLIYINKDQKQIRISAKIGQAATPQGTIGFSFKVDGIILDTISNVSKTLNGGIMPFNTKILRIKPTIDKMLISDISACPVVQIEQGLQNIKILKIDLQKTSDSKNGVELGSIKIKRTLNATFRDQDIVFKVFRGDTLISSGRDKFSGTGELVIAFNYPEIVNAAESYYIACDIAPEAVIHSNIEGISSLIEVQIDSISAFNVTAPDLATLLDGLSLPRTTNLIKITDKPDLFTLKPLAFSTGEVEARQGKTFAVAEFSVSTDYDYSLWGSIEIAKTWNPEMTPLSNQLIGWVRIYRDDDNDGTFSTADTCVTADSSFDQNNISTLTFTIPQRINVNIKKYFVVLNISNLQEVIGKSIGIKINSVNNIHLIDIEGRSDLKAMTTEPFYSANFTVIDRYAPSKPVIKVLEIEDYSASIDQIKFSWESHAENGIDIVRYCIGQIAGGSDILPLTEVNPKGASSGIITVNNLLTILKQNMVFYVSVETKSHTDLGKDIWSIRTITLGTKIDITVPAAPDPLSINPSGSFEEIGTSMKIENGIYSLCWQPAVDPDSGIVSYELQEKIGTSPVWNTINELSPEIVQYNIVKTNTYNTFEYRIRAKNGSGLLSDWIYTTKQVIVGSTSTLIKNVSNWPNPFDSRKTDTTITFLLSGLEKCNITVKIFDSFGKLVTTLEKQKQDPGTINIIWDGTNGTGKKISKGVYIAIINAESASGKSQKEIRKIGVIH